MLSFTGLLMITHVSCLRIGKVRHFYSIFHITLFPLERRSLKTPKEYVEAYKKFVATFEKVLDEAQQEFLKGLNLDKKDFFGAAEAYMKEGNADIRFIYVDFANKLL